MVTLRVRAIEFIVGLFMIAGLAALVILAFKVSGLVHIGNGHYYQLIAEFDNVGDLKVNAPVSISGVRVGRVSHISIDTNNFRARVKLAVDKDINTLPVDTSASIFTQGILGANYISLAPGFEEENLKNGDRVETTHSALILENLIGQLIYSLRGDSAHSTDSKEEDKNSDELDNSNSR